MHPEPSFVLARRSRQIAAGIVDGSVCSLLFLIGFTVSTGCLPTFHAEAPEQITRFLMGPMIATVFCLWYARGELGRGTLGQKLTRVRRVRLDGQPMQPADWWKRHWPSLLFIVYGVALIATSIVGSEKIKWDRQYIEWMQFWGAIISLGAVALLIAAYLITRSTAKTMLVEKPRIYTGHGFEVMPIERCD